MKYEISEENAIQAFEHILSRISFLKLQTIERQNTTRTSIHRAELVANVRIGDEVWTIVGEYKSRGQPRQVREAVFQLSDYLSRMPDAHNYGLILAPFISEQSAQICRESGIGFVDLAGNCFLSFDRVFIETRSADNPFRARKALQSLFTPKAARVLRILLEPPIRTWKVADLQKAAGVSLGHVSNVRKLLLDHEWASAVEGGLRVTEPEGLLREWGKAYKPRSQTKRSFYTPLHGERLENAMRLSMANDKGRHAVLASFSAARWLAPYARQGTHYFYADHTGRQLVKESMKLEPIAKGENVVIQEPKENDVFIGRVESAEGIWCTGAVQTWLDLNSSGERGMEAAEHLLQSKLLPAWREIAS